MLFRSIEKTFQELRNYGDQAGMHLIWKLSQSFPSAKEVEDIGLNAGVGVCSLATGSALSFDSENEQRLLMLGFAALTEEEIENGVSRLASALKM